MLNRMAERDARARDRLIGRAVELSRSPQAAPVGVASAATPTLVSTALENELFSTFDENGNTVDDFTIGLDAVGDGARVRVRGEIYDYGT